MTSTCTHGEAITPSEAPLTGVYEECLEAGDEWEYLRSRMTCGAIRLHEQFCEVRNPGCRSLT